MRLVIFDVDGTLVDSGAEIARRVHGAFDRLGLPQPSDRTIRANVGLSLALYMQVVGDTHDSATIDALVAAYRTVAAEAPSGLMPLFPRAREAVLRLGDRPDTVLGIATGKGLAGLQRTLAENDLTSAFVTLQTPDTNPSKPHPAMILAAMAEAGVGPEGTVMIGDAGFDVEMARAAGCPVIGVSWGMQSPGSLITAGANAIAESFDDLDGLIDLVLEKKHA